MVSSINVDISSADESSADNAKSPFNKFEPTKHYQRTRSYDESYYCRPTAKSQEKVSEKQRRQQPKVPPTNRTRDYPTLPSYIGVDGPVQYSDQYRGAYAYGSGYIYPQGHFGFHPPFRPSVYMAGYAAEPERRAPFPQCAQQADKTYGSTPILNFGANSYLGWHQRAPATRVVYRSMLMNNRNLDSISAGAEFLVNPFPSGDSKIQRSSSVSGSPDAIQGALVQKETVRPFFNDHQQRGKLSSGASLCLSDNSSIHGLAAVRRSRVKLCVITSIVVILLAILVAMGIAVYSQVSTQNSIVKLVRQYRASFVVIGGRQLDFDADLLNPPSASFRGKAKDFEHKIDKVFRDSGLSSIYEGAEVTAFRFVSEPPGLEVQFDIKIKVNVQLQVSDILAMMNDAIRHNVNGAFRDTVIDPNSLNVENQRL